MNDFREIIDEEVMNAEIPVDEEKEAAEEELLLLYEEDEG